MPEALRDSVPVLALVVLLAAAYLHPAELVEATLAAGCTMAVLATGELGGGRARTELDHLLPVVLFLVAILVVAECCRAAGLFRAVGTRLARAGSHQRIFMTAFLAATATTVALSLDATVVLLTPVVLASAAVTGVGARPLQLVCVRLANSASLLLPVSNLTNLLALPRIDVGFGRFALLMAPVWVLTLLVEYAVQRMWFRTDLRTAAPHREAPHAVRLPVVPLVTVLVMLTGFGVGSLVDVAPAWPAAAAAVVLAARGLRRRELSARRLAHSTHASFGLFVVSLGLVVATLGRGPLGDLLSALVPDGVGVGALLATALVGAVLANLVNNLPATLLIVPLVAPLGTVPALAALIGVNLGSSMTWSGSLANLLWRRSVVHHGGTVSSRDFHAVALLATPVAIAGGVVLLDTWAHLV